MAATTPRRSLRIPHTHTPKMTERKKTLFHNENDASRESLTMHRHLPVVDSESDSDECDLGIISTLDSSSGDETDPNVLKTPDRSHWHETRSHNKVLKENHDLKNFMKSPFTLKKYQTRYSCPETRCGSLSTPATPHIQHHPGTPSSTHSCASVHTISSTSSKARKSLASLIADTESCSSSLKDLNFDTDSGTDSKENTPTKVLRRSNRRHKMTPKFQSFKGILVEQKKNVTPMKNAVVCLTKMDMSSYISPTQMLKTPNNTSENKGSPPKLSRRSVLEVAESPESTCDSEKSHKRLHYEGMTDTGPLSKQPRLDPSVTPKARLSLFNSEKLKEILSTKSFYGKSNPDLNTTICNKISHAIEATNTQRQRPFSHSHSHRRKRKPGQINMGVKHRIRKPKIHKSKIVTSSGFKNTITTEINGSYEQPANKSQNKDISIISQSSVDENVDLFDKEKQTIQALLSQWTEEEVPESELIHMKPQQELPCFNQTVIEETNPIFQPVTAVLVTDSLKPLDSDTVIEELGTPNIRSISAPNVASINTQNTAIMSTENNSHMSTANSAHISTQSVPSKSSENVAIMSTPNIASMSTQNVASMPANFPQNVAQILSTSHVVDVTTEVQSDMHDVVMMDHEGHAASHGENPKVEEFLPVEGGYIYVDGDVYGQKEIPDLDEIERELKMLDEQILMMAESNNIDAKAVLASTETKSVVSGVNAGNYSEKSNENSQKLFSIFSRPNPGINSPTSKGNEDKSKKILLKNGNNQYVIDAGQKRFGATQCAECGVIYQIGDPQDEHDHLVHHSATDVLKFNGWKEECIVDRTVTGRCIRVRGGEAGWKRVQSVLSRVVHPQLGYASDLPRTVHTYTAFLYIEKKQIVGCLIMEPKSRAYKLLPGDPDCCSVEDYPVKCGVSRIWTHKSYRRRGIAVRLLECARASLLHGMAVLRSEVAFSAPTPSGKALATSYCGTPNFYVYLD